MYRLTGGSPCSTSQDNCWCGYGSSVHQEENYSKSDFLSAILHLLSSLFQLYRTQLFYHSVGFLPDSLRTLLSADHLEHLSHKGNAMVLNGRADKRHTSLLRRSVLCTPDGYVCQAHINENLFRPTLPAAIPLSLKEISLELGHLESDIPGSGYLNLKPILEGLVEIGYNGYLSIECFPKQCGEESASKGLQYMKSLERSVHL